VLPWLTRAWDKVLYRERGKRKKINFWFKWGKMEPIPGNARFFPQHKISISDWIIYYMFREARCLEVRGRSECSCRSAATRTLAGHDGAEAFQ